MGTSWVLNPLSYNGNSLQHISLDPLFHFLFLAGALTHQDCFSLYKLSDLEQIITELYITYIYICVCVCMCVCIYMLYICVCMCVCVCVYMAAPVACRSSQARD